MKRFLLLLCAIMSINVLTAQKNVLVEESTGTWCQYCPSGIYYMDSLVTMYDNVIAVAIHTSDVMAVEDYFNASGFNQAPEANIGRRYMNKGVSDWFTFVEQEMNTQPKATVAVVNQFNEASRLLTSTITVTALENISGTYTIGAIITEDAVTGPAPQYNQANQFSNYYFPMGGFENLPNPVPANRMAYDHVARQLLGGFTGEAGMPSSLAAGETYTHTFTYTVPENFNHNYLKVIGVLIASDGTIENAGQSVYANGEHNAAPKFTSTPVTENFALINYLYNIYVHDTDNKDLTITVEEKPEWLTFEQYDNKSAALYGMTQTAGEYDIVIKVTDGETETVQSYTLVVSEPLDASWEYLGLRGITESSIYMYLFGSCSHNGNVFLFVKEYNCPAVYKYDGVVGQWSKLGSLEDNMAYDGGIAVDQNGVVYIVYSLMGDQQLDSDDYVKVKKYENDQWSDVGNFNKAGGVTKLAMGTDNILYLSFRDYGANSRYYVYRFINNEWERVGGEVSGGSWAKLALDSNNTPYVSWSDTYAGNLIYVSKLIGDVWVKVGAGVVSNESCYYYQDLAIDKDGNIYVAYCGYQNNLLNVYRYNGTEWESIGSSVTASIPIKGIDVALDSDQNFYVSFSDMNMENRMTTMKYDGEEWSFVGQRGYSDPGDSYMSMTMINDNPCVLYTDVTNGNKASAMYYMPYNFLFPPHNLAAELVGEEDVLLTWEAPQTMEMQPVSYNVYRNDAKIGNTEAFTYKDEDLNPGLHRYTVTAVYDNGESSPAGPVSIQVTVSIDENSEVAFVVYPNPAEDYVMIESVEAAEVRIYSINGQMVSAQTISEGTNTIDVSSLNAGMYFMQVNESMVKIIVR
ncbi:MAG: Omp28-related outer membrane protein [Bacteroidales bacterium]|nr:Omp28-related outer membrane protein [Bacteroidales bacterium]